MVDVGCVGIDEEGWCAVCTYRDLDYGYDTGMENLVDPSHIPVAHHGVNGGIMGKREHAAPIQLEVKKVHARGFEGQWNKPYGGAPSVHTFEAPSRFTYRFFLKTEGSVGSTTTYCTPIGEKLFSLISSNLQCPRCLFMTSRCRMEKFKVIIVISS